MNETLRDIRFIFFFRPLSESKWIFLSVDRYSIL